MTTNTPTTQSLKDYRKYCKTYQLQATKEFNKWVESHMVTMIPAETYKLGPESKEVRDYLVDNDIKVEQVQEDGRICLQLWVGKEIINMFIIPNVISLEEFLKHPRVNKAMTAPDLGLHSQQSIPLQTCETSLKDPLVLPGDLKD